MKKITLIFSLCILALTACNKEKSFSKKLMKTQRWNISTITVNGESISQKGVWFITADVDIYDSVSSVQWVDGNGKGDAIFEWQFQEKGKIFQLNYVQQKDEVDGNLLDTLDYFAYYLSGKYNVEVHKKDQMVFTSDETVQYAGKKVRIEIKRAFL